MGDVESPACSFCNQDDESLTHFFCEYHVTRKLWKDLQTVFTASLELPELNLKNAVLEYALESEDNDLNLVWEGGGGGGFLANWEPSRLQTSGALDVN